MPEETTQETTQTSAVNADGSFAENWHDKYGEDNKAHLSRYKTFDDLVNSTISTKKKLGKDPNSLVEIPTDTSSDEVRTAFRKASGVPDTVDDYKYEMPTELATKLDVIDDTKMATFKEFAHKELGLTPTKFKKLLDFYHKDIAADIETANISFTEQSAAAKAASKADLMKEWRDGYDDRVFRANSIMRKYGGEEAVAEFNAENSPKMAKFLDNIAGAMSEDTIKGLTPLTGSTATGIKSQIAEIRSQMDTIVKENPSNYKGNVKFRDLQARKTALYKSMPA